MDGVWKRYLLGEGDGLSRLWRRSDRAELWSLRDVSLSVRAGESVGLIGHNGAGKTTSLKLLAGISRPTRGRVQARGRVASLINLGAGFHRELSGRENVLLNAVILGLSRREAQRRLDEIIEFAEIGPYVDTPVKQYSTGMYARLGFAVAAHVDADVLLVDEVLSVGDVGFQDRSIRRMLRFREEGRSILFVSHNLSAVEMMCQRAIWLDHGQVRAEGPSGDVVRQYLDDVDAGLVAESRSLAREGIGDLYVQDVATFGADGQPTTDFEYGQALTVRARCIAQIDAGAPRLTITVRGDYGPLFSADTHRDGTRLGPWSSGLHEVACTFRTLPLLPGLYRIEAHLSRPGDPATSPQPAAAAFRVNTDLAHYGSTSVVGATKSRGGFIAAPYHWTVEQDGHVTCLPGIHAPGV